ncbi:MAG: hypothetical protein CM1200mP26_22010 [Acidimicrobiales bacterium]|nr:MAG: hypothetical protein CM1200mP26_22010 [Acidimicrobiales bacterium]
MVLLNHGLFTFGDDSMTAYRRHVDLINRAEAWLDQRAPLSSVADARCPKYCSRTSPAFGPLCLAMPVGR